RSGARVTRQAMTVTPRTPTAAPCRNPVPMLPGPCSRSTRPITITPPRATIMTSSTTAFWRPVISVVDMEDLLNGAVEVAGDGDGQRQRRVVAARLDGVHGLSRDLQGRPQLPLGQTGGEPEVTDVVAH